MCFEDLGCAVYILDLLGGLSYVLERLREGLAILSRADKPAT